jgi:hypothetical protein
MPILNSSGWKRRTVVVCLTSLVLAVAGCGSSSSSSSGLSKSALASKAGAICKRRSDAITAAASKVLAGGKLPSRKQFGQLAFGTIIPQTTAEASELSALKPQSSLTTSYHQWLASMRADVAKMKQNPVIIQNKASFVTVNGQARALGLSSACDLGPSS